MSINNPIPRGRIINVMVDNLNESAANYGTGLVDVIIHRHLTTRWATRQELNNFIRYLRATMRDKLNDGID